MRVVRRPFNRFGRAIRRVTWRALIRDYTLVSLGALIVAFDINLFLRPAQDPDVTMPSAGLTG